MADPIKQAIIPDQKLADTGQDNNTRNEKMNEAEMHR